MNYRRCNVCEPLPALHPKVSLDDITSAVESDDCLGYCMYCGEQAYRVEPDARRYRCESCGSFAVYGAEELLLYFVA